MPPDLLELLEEIPCYYYDGCLLVSLHDYRFSEANPQKRNVLLRVSCFVEYLSTDLPVLTC